MLLWKNCFMVSTLQTNQRFKNNYRFDLFPFCFAYDFPSSKSFRFFWRCEMLYAIISSPVNKSVWRSTPRSSLRRFNIFTSSAWFEAGMAVEYFCVVKEFVMISVNPTEESRSLILLCTLSLSFSGKSSR